MHLFELIAAGRHDEAIALQRQLVPVARLLGATHGVPGLKAALNLLGYDVGVPRPPLAAAARVDHSRAARGAGAIRGDRRMSLLPDTDRILLGPGPSLTAPRVMRAMASPTLSHLDPLMIAPAGRCARAAGARVPRRRRLVRVRGVGHRHVRHGDGGREPRAARARGRSVVVTGYFGDRLAQMCERYGATVTRLNVRVGHGRAIPTRCARSSTATPADVVAMVHAETSTGVAEPGARARGRSRASTAR